MTETSLSTLSDLERMFGAYAFGKPEAKGLWYHNQTLTLDGYRFVGCRFDSCTLNVNSGEIYLDHCIISGDTRILWGPSVIRALRNRPRSCEASHLPKCASTSSLKTLLISSSAPGSRRSAIISFVAALT